MKFHVPVSFRRSGFRADIGSKIGAALVSLALFGEFSHSSAATLLNTIQGDVFNGPGAQLFLVGSNGIITESLAVPFTSAIPTTITGVEAYISGVFGPQVDLGIMADIGGLPSGTFLTGDHLVLTPNNITPINVNSLSWPIGAGSFWLAVLPIGGTSSGWQFNENLTGSVAAEQGAGWFITNAHLPEAIITSTDASATPLPAALPLFAGGLSVLALFGWRRKKKAVLADEQSAN